MAKDTIAIDLKGHVPLEEYAEAVEQFNQMLKALSKEIAGDVEIEWEISQLRAGSAFTEARGRSVVQDADSKVVAGAGVVGASLQRRDPIPYSEDVIEPAIKLNRLLNGHIKEIHFITDAGITEIKAPPIVEEEEKSEKKFSLGTIRGVVKTITILHGPSLTLYDPLFNLAIKCRLTSSQLEDYKETIGKVVEVTGEIYRDEKTGRPLQLREVTAVKPIAKPEKNLYKQAAGILPWDDPNNPPEKIIRGLRDAD